jgi:hypothetical protein
MTKKKTKKKTTGKAAVKTGNTTIFLKILIITCLTCATVASLVFALFLIPQNQIHLEQHPAKTDTTSRVAKNKSKKNI